MGDRLAVEAQDCYFGGNCGKTRIGQCRILFRRSRSALDCGADPLVRSRPPGRLAGSQIKLIRWRRASVADAWTRGSVPQSNADREAMRKVCGIRPYRVL
jgi:hypothetical protein